MADGLEIDSVTFQERALVISYMDLPTDVRVGGNVAQQHSVRLDARHPDYREDMDALHHQVIRVLRNALEDFGSSEPYIPEADDEEDGEMGS